MIVPVIFGRLRSSHSQVRWDFLVLNYLSTHFELNRRFCIPLIIYNLHRTAMMPLSPDKPHVLQLGIFHTFWNYWIFFLQMLLIMSALHCVSSFCKRTNIFWWVMSASHYTQVIGNCGPIELSFQLLCFTCGFLKASYWAQCWGDFNKVRELVFMGYILGSWIVKPNRIAPNIPGPAIQFCLDQCIPYRWNVFRF